MTQPDVVERQQADIDKLLAERQQWLDEIERLRAENDMLRSLLIDAPTKEERDELFAHRFAEPKP